ncbi:hypothetical protein [Rhizobium sp. L43]|uniref:hypothetical protein n=1 Tax=Rhizobium sp. L43 TaxID=2035452 RepID=UPI000BE9B7C4|nr:hypothetical protein [Rhizobium sp. L43]PDS75455.1 hypothetical protein CO667_26600 [Rhizobium sp. L43]
MRPITDAPNPLDPETGQSIRLEAFTREPDGPWIMIEDRQRGEGFVAVRYADGTIWDSVLADAGGDGWR